MESKVKNMTSGSPGKLIMAFAVPLMLGNIFQQLYTMVDTMVVGQIVGVEALAALGAADWLVWLVLGLASGMTQGFSILFAHHFPFFTLTLALAPFSIYSPCFGRTGNSRPCRS